ncbi:hypothetical protein [Streptomyces sp. A0592]|uniref:hypothetical protein n=1 Tax=Streptomyces sp. A0592 TaxID=2563099 RepID=UPI00109ED8BE|nr:hypothetical protein [Streptomyces sp. A0592]THA81233.1 hypothetical protein E6U81_25710 [Streptomyces sp. A0592]
MEDHEDELVLRVRAVLAEAGFEESAPGEEGVHLIRHARGVLIGWLPVQVTRPEQVAPRDIADPADHDVLRHAFMLAATSALQSAGFVVDPRDDQGLLVLDPEQTSAP